MLQQANNAGLNMVIVHEPTFYSDGDRIDLVKDDPLYKAKQHWADLNNMVVWRIHDHWHATQTGWHSHRLDQGCGLGSVPREWQPQRFQDSRDHTGRTRQRNGAQVRHPERACDWRSALKVSRVRTGGRAISQIMDNLTNFDCLISNDNREYDTYEYMRDIVLSGEKKERSSPRIPLAKTRAWKSSNAGQNRSSRKYRSSLSRPRMSSGQCRTSDHQSRARHMIRIKAPHAGLFCLMKYARKHQNIAAQYLVERPSALSYNRRRPALVVLTLHFSDDQHPCF